MGQVHQELEIGEFEVGRRPAPPFEVLDHLLLRRPLGGSVQNGEVVVFQDVVPVVARLTAGHIHDEEIGLDLVRVAALVQKLGHEVLA